MSLELWYILVDSDGQPYEGTSAERVAVSLNADISTLRRTVKNDAPEILGLITASRLKIYKNKDSFDSKEMPLEANSVITGLGASMDDALVILVPQPLTSLSASEGLILAAHVAIAFVVSLGAHCKCPCLFLCVHAGDESKLMCRCLRVNVRASSAILMYVLHTMNTQIWCTILYLILTLTPKPGAPKICTHDDEVHMCAPSLLRWLKYQVPTLMS